MTEYSPSTTGEYPSVIFFSARKRAKFNKSCNLTGFWGGRNCLIQTATATVIFSLVKITWHVYAQKLTWYFTGVCIIDSDIYPWTCVIFFCSKLTVFFRLRSRNVLSGERGGATRSLKDSSAFFKLQLYNDTDNSLHYISVPRTFVHEFSYKGFRPRSGSVKVTKCWVSDKVARGHAAGNK